MVKTSPRFSPHIIYSNTVSCLTVSTSFGKCHQSPVWRECKSTVIIVLWRSYELNAAVSQTPYCQSYFKVGYCDKVIVIRTPPSMCKPCNTFIHFTIPVCIVNVFHEHLGSFSYCYHNQSSILRPFQLGHYINKAIAVHWA